MHRPRTRCRSTARLVIGMVCVALSTPVSAQRPLRPFPEALAAAPPELIDRLRVDPFSYFRFINRAWTARVCERFTDVTDAPTVRLHGDAHLEQFALTKDAWGLGDFDDSTRGPSFIDLVRFMGSIDLATRQRGWTDKREALLDRFLEGYRLGLSNSNYRPREPGIVRELRRHAPVDRAAYIAWGEGLMQPMDDADYQSVVQGMEAFERFMRPERPDLAPGYFAVIRAGWLRIGVGSAAAKKVLVRVQGPTTAREDDVLIEAKEVANLDGLGCLETSATRQAARVISGTRQIGRLKYDILAVGPTVLIPSVGRAEHWLDWCVSSWEPSYREVNLSDLRSVADLADLVFDSGVQLGANKLSTAREPALAAVVKYEARLRTETSAIVEELLAGWRELANP